MSTERKKIEIEWSPVDNDYACSVPTNQGTHMAHGRSPVLALQKALRMAGASGYQAIVIEKEPRS